MKVKRLNNKNFLDAFLLIDKCRDFRNFYITKNNVRYPIKDYKLVTKVVNDCTKWNEILYGYFNENKLIAIAFITGFKEKTRKYIKTLTIEDNFKILDDLVRVIFWNHGQETYAKVEKGNRILIAVLKKNKFRFLGDRGREVLLKREKYKIERFGQRDGKNSQNNKSIGSRPSN